MNKGKGYSSRETKKINIFIGYPALTALTALSPGNVPGTGGTAPLAEALVRNPGPSWNFKLAGIADVWGHLRQAATPRPLRDRQTQEFRAAVPTCTLFRHFSEIAVGPWDPKGGSSPRIGTGPRPLSPFVVARFEIFSNRIATKAARMP